MFTAHDVHLVSNVYGHLIEWEDHFYAYVIAAQLWVTEAEFKYVLVNVATA